MDNNVSSYSIPAAAAVAPAPARDPPISQQSVFMQWFQHDIPYIAMLLMALVGVVFRLPVTYRGF